MVRHLDVGSFFPKTIKITIGGSAQTQTTKENDTISLWKILKVGHHHFKHKINYYWGHAILEKRIFPL